MDVPVSHRGSSKYDITLPSTIIREFMKHYAASYYATGEIEH